MFKKHKSSSNKDTDKDADADADADADKDKDKEKETDKDKDNDTFDFKMVQILFKKLNDRIDKLDKGYDELINKIQNNNKKRIIKKYKVLKD